jgi:hypothetical protein
MSELSFPSSPATGARYISPNGHPYFYDGRVWSSTGTTINPNPIANNTFLYRTIYTRGYTHCGYQNGSPWKNTNRTVHVSDTTTNLGDMMDNNSSYIDGGFSDYNTYVFNNSGGVGGNSTITSTMSMITESLRTISSSRYMTVGRSNCKALMNPGLTAIYITAGGNSTTDKFNTLTDTMMYASYVGGSGSGSNNGMSGFWGATYGIIGASGTSGWLAWSTETWTTGTWSWGANNSDGQPKGLSSKWGLGYNSNGSYPGTTTYYKFNDTTGANITNFSRPFKAGEENCQVGQDWGYTLGCYNDVGDGQNNRSTKQSYLTDSCVELGSAGQPKGHGGMSSGCCGTGSVTLLGGTMGTSI